MVEMEIGLAARSQRYASIMPVNKLKTDDLLVVISKSRRVFGIEGNGADVKRRLMRLKHDD